MTSYQKIEAKVGVRLILGFDLYMSEYGTSCTSVCQVRVPQRIGCLRNSLSTACAGMVGYLLYTDKLAERKN